MNKVGKNETNTNWHECAVETVLHALKTTANGLYQAEAAVRLETYGPNCLPETAKRGVLVRFFLHFHSILIYVLLGCAGITMMLDHFVDTAVIIAVVIANAGIGFVQEGKAEKAMDSIRRMLALRASVVRDGNRQNIEGELLVPGDIVLLEAGDKVPADIRMLETHGLQIQEAILTGESVPVEKHSRPVAANAVLGDRVCMAFSGTLVTSGQGKGVVVGTGTETEIGHISNMLSKVEMLATPLIKQMNVFAQWLTFLILLVAMMLLVFGYFVQHFEFTELFMAVVSLSVAAIPEGLPAVLTITLAVGVQAMARRNAIVRRLPAIETLGSVSVICTDKTGTLTRNEMMVASVVTHVHIFSFEGNGYEPNGVVKLNDSSVSGCDYAILDELGRTAVLCNDASLHKREGIWIVEGDPMEGALITLSKKIGIDTRKELSTWARTDAIPFDSKHCFMATLNHDHENHAFVSVKGAPEQLFAMCNEQRSTSGGTEPLNLAYWHEMIENIAAQGQRVLAFAVKPVAHKHTVLEFSDVEKGLILIGLAGLIDPPRPEAIKAVAECHGAGIRVKMITGDHKGTATAIGKQIGLHNLDKVLTGPDLDAMNDAALATVIQETDIYARTSPEHKLRIVMALQSHGMTVAMTGDGVNDTPALKRADAGIAMGMKGSDAAKEAAELVLADDNFASIVVAVREGRTVYDNIKKVISWSIPTSTGEAMTIIVALLFGMTLPITPIQILWVNLITAITLGLALAFEPTEADTMRHPPRPRNEPLLKGWLVWHIVLVSILFLCGVFGIYNYSVDRGYSLELTRTLAMNTLVVMEIFHLFFIRNIYGTSLTWKAIRGTKVVWATTVIVIAAQLAITYLAPLQKIFATESMSLFDGILIIGIGIALFTIIEIEKQFRLSFTHRVVAVQ